MRWNRCHTRYRVVSVIWKFCITLIPFQTCEYMTFIPLWMCSLIILKSADDDPHYRFVSTWMFYEVFCWIQIGLVQSMYTQILAFNMEL